VAPSGAGARRGLRHGLSRAALHSIDPRLGEGHAGEPRQTPDGLVDLAGGCAPVASAQQIPCDERDLVIGLHAASHGRPEAIDQEARHPLDGGPSEPRLRLVVIEAEVAGLVADDASEEVDEHRVRRELGESLVAGERGELVDGAPDHVHGGKVRPCARQDAHGLLLEPTDQVPPRALSHDRRMTRCGEEARERPPVERLLVEPARQERCHLGIVDDARREQLAHVHHGVALDVLHVEQRADGLGRQRRARDLVPCQAIEIQRTRALRPGIDPRLVHALTTGATGSSDGTAPSFADAQRFATGATGR